METKPLKNHPGMWMRADAADAMNALEDKHGVIRLNRAGVAKADQQKLIDRWHQGGAANRPPNLYQPAEPADSSEHVQGTAADVYNYTSDRAKLNEFGFVWYGTKDPVHYTFKGWSGGGSVARAGYQNGTEDLTRFQRKLIQMGHDLGPTGADSVFGPKTEQATRFEQTMAPKNGYPGGAVSVDGTPGPQTEAYLDWWLTGRFNRPSPKSAGELNYSDIQSALKRKGYDLVVDGIWGPKSSNALADFQSRNGLKVDRIVGPATWAKLNT